MNLLLENGLPEEIDGYPISPDFRNMIRFDLILQDEKMSEGEKLYLGLCQLWLDIPRDAEWAVQKLLWFYGCGQDKKEGGPSGARREMPRAYDFAEDAALIYAGFYAAYGISLTTTPFLHWWEFVALLTALPDTTLMGQVMRWRTADLSEIKDKHQRKFLEAQQKRWALKKQLRAPARTAQELEQATLERVRKRNEEVRRMMEEERQKGR